MIWRYYDLKLWIFRHSTLLPQGLFSPARLIGYSQVFVLPKIRFIAIKLYFMTNKQTEKRKILVKTAKNTIFDIILKKMIVFIDFMRNISYNGLSK